MTKLPPPAASLWRQGTDQEVSYPALSQDCTCDVAIVGGGYTGLHAALTLAEAGLRVVVLEAGTPGSGGSGRNGGVVSAKFRRSFAELARSEGIDTARRMHAIATGSVDHLKRMIDTLDLSEAAFREDGALKCAHSQRAFDHACEEAEWLRQELGDSGLEVLDADALARETGSTHFVGGVLQRGAGTIQPLAYLLGLWAAAHARGTILHALTPALSVKEADGRVDIATPGGKVAADRALLATNAYSWVTPAGKAISRSVVPFRSAMIATAPLPEALNEQLLINARSYTETRRMMRWFRKVDGRVIFGGRGALGAVDAPAAFRRLETAMTKIFPNLKGTPTEYRWSGQVALTFDGLPHAGFLSPRVGYAAGFNGAGVAMSGYVGDQIARQMIGTPHDLSMIARTKLPNVPFYPLRSVAVRATTSYYEILDAVGL